MTNRDRYFTHRTTTLQEMAARLFSDSVTKEIASSSMFAVAQLAQDIALYAYDTAARAAWCDDAKETDIEFHCARWLTEEQAETA